jgi:hypothetical protein
MLQSLDVANQVSYLFILALFLVQLTLSHPDVNMEILYSPDAKSFFPIQVFRTIMEFIPSYTFSMVFGLLCGISSSKFDMNAANWLDGRPFKEEDWHAPSILIMNAINTTVVAPSIADF